MSMSLHVTGIKPPDNKWTKMKRVWDACQVAGIEPPSEVTEFFEGEAPDDEGVKVDIEYHECCSELKEADQDGFVVDISKLPKGTKLLKFYASY